MKRPAKILAAAAITAALFISCAKEAELPAGAFVPYETVKPSDLTGVSAGPGENELIKWQKGRILSRKAIVPGAAWAVKMRFQPEGFYIRKKSDKGVELLAPEVLEDITFSNDRALVAYTMRMGTSPNSTIGIADTGSGEVILDIPVEMRSGKRQHAAGLAVAESFFRPKFTDDGRVIYESFDSLGIRRVRLVTLQNETVKIFENASYALTTPGKVYFLKWQGDSKEPYFASAGLDTLNEKKISDLPENALTGLVAERGKIFLSGFGAVYVLDEEKGKFEVFYGFEAEKNAAKVFEINRMYSVGGKDSAYIIALVKRFADNNYSWQMYGAGIK